MPKIKYIEHRFSTASLRLINLANNIIGFYRDQGFTLTIRQLYYQFISRDVLPNTTASYNRIGSLINAARLAGEVDWDAIEDRTRHVDSLAHWENPQSIVESAAQQYRIDKWASQRIRPEIWIEKEALSGIVAKVCHDNDISFLSCRGYTSQSEMWRSAMRMSNMLNEDGQTPLVLHLGDHDPSGLDMTRDIRDRLALLAKFEIEVKRIALNMDQIRKYNPPPNPAKITDSRFSAYARQYGKKSWELDALEPKILVALIQKEVTALRNKDRWTVEVASEEKDRQWLKSLIER